MTEKEEEEGMVVKVVSMIVAPLFALPEAGTGQ